MKRPSKAQKEGTNGHSQDKEVATKDANHIGDPSVLLTTWVWFNTILWVPLTGIPALLVILLTPFVGLSQAQRLTWRCAVVFFRIVLWSSMCPYTVQGLENLDPEQHYFFASNHESLWDVPLLFATLPFWLISVAKKSLRSIPIFGWAVAAGGTVWVDRKNQQKAIKSMKEAEESLRSRPRSVLIFPEGTRTEDGNLQTFKKGVFVLTIQAGMPVVPVVVCGTYDVVVKGGRTVRRRPLKVIIGKPITTEGLAYEDRDALAEKVRNAMVEMKAEWEKTGRLCENRQVEPFWHCFVPTPGVKARDFWGRV